ncbi:hypothetical protein MesoLjLb_64430 [Mesorhizobium sp. L-8-3]|nr:hypothetical protein MesoLjLb_64430 [Mesorhizobium sp. L-8-3]
MTSGNAKDEPTRKVVVRSSATPYIGARPVEDAGPSSTLARIVKTGTRVSGILCRVQVTGNS